MLKYIKLAFKKPYLIRDAFYKRHVGLILSCNIKDYMAFNKNNIPVNHNKYKFQISKDVEQIYNFYQKMGRSSITREKISEWLQDGHHCWLAILDGKVVGGLWIFFGQVTINTLSLRVLSKNKTIMFDKDTGYRGYVIIDPNYRGQGIYKLLNDYIMHYYYKNESIENILLITGVSNGPVIRTIMNSYGRLVGIVEVRNIMGKVVRKELFIDQKEKTWK